MTDLTFPFEAPATGTVREVAPGVLWLRMPLPFVLDHINLWLLRDGGGWTVVDTGLRTAETIAIWENLLRDVLNGDPVTRVIVTHQHADHSGLAGWFTARFSCPLWMTRGEYLTVRTAMHRADEGLTPELSDFYRRAGWSESEVDAYDARRREVWNFVTPLPDAYRRLRDGDTLAIGDRSWRVIIGGGHSPEHACLYSPEAGLLISGDKVLPRISSNISVDPLEPDSDPMGEWFDTLARVRREVADDVLVLPSHNLCFRGLHARIDSLVAEQERALTRVRDTLANPCRAVDLFGIIFGRPIDSSNIGLFSLATGETIAALNRLIETGAIRYDVAGDGVLWYRQAEDAETA